MMRTQRDRADSVLDRMREQWPSLGPSEQRVAAVVLESPAEVVEWSTAQLAAAADSSPATVVRTCQHLGYRGFQHLRLELARVAASDGRATGDDAAGSADGEESAARDDARTALERAFVAASRSLAAGARSLDAHAFERAVDVLSGAGRVLLVGSGFSGPPLQDAAMRFTASGRPADAPVDVLAQRFAAEGLRPGDACLALSHSGANRETVAACESAMRRGADVVVVTSFTRSPIARTADVLLATGASTVRHDIDPAESRLHHLLVLALLADALAARTGAPKDVPAVRRIVAEALAEDD